VLGRRAQSATDPRYPPATRAVYKHTSGHFYECVCLCIARRRFIKSKSNRSVRDKYTFLLYDGRLYTIIQCQYWSAEMEMERVRVGPICRQTDFVWIIRSVRVEILAKYTHHMPGKLL